MKKMIVSYIFLAIGAANTALIANIAALNFKAAVLYPSLSMHYQIAGYTCIVLSLVFMTAGVVLAVKGTDNMVGMDDDDEYQHHLDLQAEAEQAHMEVQQNLEE
jgi:hypothetical protein